MDNAYPHDPEAVLSKIDIKLRTPTPTGPPADGSPWVSQTPHTAAEALSQSQLVQGRIENDQGSSPTTLFQAVKQLAGGTEAMAYEMVLLRSDPKATQEANKALAKRWWARRTRLQDGGTLIADAAWGLFTEKESGSRKKGKEVEEGGLSKARPATVRCYGRRAKSGHNVRTCPVAPESSDEDSEMDSDSFFYLVWSQLNWDVVVLRKSDPRSGEPRYQYFLTQY